MERLIMGRRYAQIWLAFFASFLVLMVISIFTDFSSLLSSSKNSVSFLVNDYVNFINTNNIQSPHVTASENNCSGRYIYVHNLPTRFNDEVLRDCHSLIKWFDMCPSLHNSGLGPRLPKSARSIFSGKNWYSTSQFLLEQIFRNRMKQYQCLTHNSSLASAIYVPVYIGLDLGRFLWVNTSRRDSMSLDLVHWLVEQPEWKRMWGRDHFFVAGRTGGDFRRIRDRENDWGSILMRLPEASNMTMLSIEGTAWNSDVGIPYPTYFHPANGEEVLQWQERVTKRTRKKLFAFVGAPRPSLEDSIRGELIRECQAANDSCLLVNCNMVSCDDPRIVMKAFMDTVFCLQPPGDSFTRRSSFDSILAGCIPVFFHPGSAYLQYVWHFPKNHSDYSVFIHADDVKSGKVSVQETLHRIAEEDVVRIRANVIEMIPRIVYSDPNSNLKTMKDAFDVTVKAVLERVEGLRRDVDSGFVDKPDWRSKLNATIEAKLWAPFVVGKKEEWWFLKFPVLISLCVVLVGGFIILFVCLLGRL